jgi:hypothetical protein
MARVQYRRQKAMVKTIDIRDTTGQGRSLTIIDEAHKAHKELRQRKPRLATLIKRARQAGATSISTPDGYTYTVGSDTDDGYSPWDEVSIDAPTQKRPS